MIDTPRTVLLIGAAGLVGSHLARALDRERVVCTYHRVPVTHGLELDITDTVASRKLIVEERPDLIVLAAAQPWVDLCERDPEGTRKVNVDAAMNIRDIALDLGSALLVLSSEYVFDGRAGPYDEDDLVGPLNEYGRQKVALEAIARTVPAHLICRTSGVFGQELARKNFVCQLIDRVSAGDPFPVASDQVITPTYAPDLAQALAHLIRVTATGTFNVVGPRVVRRTELARMVARTFRLTEHLIEERPSGEMGYSALRPLHGGLRDDKLRKTLGYALREPDEALEDMRASQDLERLI